MRRLVWLSILSERLLFNLWAQTLSNYTWRKSTQRRTSIHGKLLHLWTGETRFQVAPHARGNTVVKIPANLIVPAGDLAPVAIAVCGASHVILPSNLSTKKKYTRTVTLRLTAGELKAVEHQREIYANHVSISLSPLGIVIRKIQLVALWTPLSLILCCTTKGGTACGLTRYAYFHRGHSSGCCEGQCKRNAKAR